jgi:hypothetical protein
MAASLFLHPVPRDAPPCSRRISRTPNACGRTARREKCGLRIQRNVQFLGELLRIERAAREVPPANFDRRYFAAAVVHAEHQVLSLRFLVHIDFFKRDAAFTKELFRPSAVRAPRSCVKADAFHGGTQCAGLLPPAPARVATSSQVCARATACSTASQSVEAAETPLASIFCASARAD